MPFPDAAMAAVGHKTAQEDLKMGWIVALIVGGIAGWLASMVMNRDKSMGIFWNIVVGCVGSVIGNLIARPLGFAGSVQEFSLSGLIIAVVGAVVLLGIVNLVQEGSVRGLGPFPPPHSGGPVPIQGAHALGRRGLTVHRNRIAGRGGLHTAPKGCWATVCLAHQT
jgi:uncharacterized membrane protein YeaQ/YmgE (transglycosylase-associated protein family)